MATLADAEYQRLDELIHSALLAVRKCVDRDNVDISAPAVAHLRSVTKMSDRLLTTRTLFAEDEATLRAIVTECIVKGHCL